MSIFFPVHTGVRQECVLAPSLFNTCMDCILGRIVDQSLCEASFGNTKITGLGVADDAVIFAESLEVQVMALEALYEEAKALGLEISWPKTKAVSTLSGSARWALVAEWVSLTSEAVLPDEVKVQTFHFQTEPVRLYP